LGVLDDPRWGGGPRPYAPSIDQIEPNAGYTKTNCRLILSSLNAFKQRMPDAEVLLIMKATLNNMENKNDK
jgi:hypothetical protein